jgi:hypothetical protein
VSTFATSRTETKYLGRTNDIGFCEEKYRLLDEFLEAVHELSALQSEQTRSVIRGEPDFLRFDLPLHFAQEKKERAKYAWIAHVEDHGCHDGGTYRWD